MSDAGSTRFAPRTGQVVLPPAASDLAPADQVRSLYRLSDPALSELGLEEFLDELLVRVREVLAVDTVAILLHDEGTQQLVARAAKGIEEEVEQGVRIPIGRGFAGRIAQERVAIFIEDVDHADIMNPILRQKRIRSLLGVPLIVDGDLIGVLHVGSLKRRIFGPRDLAVLQVAAARAGPGIERARLYSALEHEHRVAMVLQRSLLPKQLIDAAGISAAARYMPASYDVGLSVAPGTVRHRDRRCGRTWLEGCGADGPAAHGASCLRGGRPHPGADASAGGSFHAHDA